MKILKEIGGFIVLSGPLFPLLVYFILAIVVSIVATVKGARRGRKRWGIYSFLMFSLILFWETPLVLHQYRDACENQAGFVVHKTLDQWKQENPGVAETLIPSKVPEQYLIESEHDGRVKHYRLPDGMEVTARFWAGGKSQGADFKRPDDTKGYWLNQRFIWETKRTQGLLVGKVDERVVDRKTGEIVAQYIDFASHPPWRTDGEWFLLNPQNWKFWLGRESCKRAGQNLPKKRFNEFYHLIKYQEEIKL